MVKATVTCRASVTASATCLGVMDKQRAEKFSEKFTGMRRAGRQAGHVIQVAATRRVVRHIAAEQKKRIHLHSLNKITSRVYLLTSEWRTCLANDAARPTARHFVV